jgi:hypothetical protein
MKIEALPGPSVLSDGVLAAIRLGRAGEQIVTEVHGKYYETNYRGNLFHAVMAAGVIFPAPASLTNNPMSLYNPIGSGKNLVLVSFDMIFTVIPGTPLTGLYGLYVNSNPSAAATTGALITAQPGLIGGGQAPVAKPFGTSGVPLAPTLLWPFATKVTGEVATVNPITGVPSLHIDFDGQIILTPGTTITPQQTVADTTNATVICRFAWEEVPI